MYCNVGELFVKLCRRVNRDEKYHDWHGDRAGGFVECNPEPAQLA